MNYKDLFMYNRALIVGIIASLIDTGTLFGLSYTNLNDTYSLIISSFLGILIQFFGQKYWTFKDVSETRLDLIKQVIQFFALEITIVFIIIYVFQIVNKHISDIIAKYPSSYASGKFTKYFFKLENNVIVLSPLSKILLKTVLVFILFNLISYPMWHYVIFKPTKNV